MEIASALSGRPGTAPRAILMSGLQGAGKTTLARAFESSGFQRLCPDEEMFRRHGHYGKDFPRGQFRVREAPILRDIAGELQRLLRGGHDVVLDHGLWTPEERRQWSTTALEAGGQPVLIYLPQSHEVRWGRIRKRNEQSLIDPNSIEFSEDDLLRHASRFIPPADDEPHIVYGGHPDEVMNQLPVRMGGHRDH
ncbi:AAA family ATPase [Streptomyces parvus]